MPDSGPRSGRNAPKKKKGSRKAIMSQSAWDKLSRRQQENLGGSRFKNVGETSSAREAGHRDRDPGMDAGRRAG